MKIFLYIVFLLPIVLQAQTINVRFYGTASYSNSFWNNWKTKGSGKDTSKVFTDIVGHNTGIKGVLDDSGNPYDNGAGYLTGQTLIPDTVIREGIYVTGFSNFHLIGLDDSARYNITLYSSRNRPDSQTTFFTVAKDTVQILSNLNNSKVAQFNGQASHGGEIVIRWYGKNTYAYMNAFTLTASPKIHPTAKVTIDSTTITNPNSVVHLDAAGSSEPGGKIISMQWLQTAGPSKAIFTPDTAKKIIVSGLFPGTYRFQLFVNDSLLNTDSTSVTVNVKPVFIPICPTPITVDSVAIGKAYMAAHPCPICPVCPAIPPRRNATGFAFITVNGVLTLKFTYDDGNP